MKKWQPILSIATSHDLDRLLYFEGPTPVGQPALGLEPASVLNDKSNILKK